MFVFIYDVYMSVIVLFIKLGENLFQKRERVVGERDEWRSLRWNGLRVVMGVTQFS